MVRSAGPESRWWSPENRSRTRRRTSSPGEVLDLSRFPDLAEVENLGKMTPARYDAEFELGLDFIVAGVEGLLADHAATREGGGAAGGAGPGEPLRLPPVSGFGGPGVPCGQGGWIRCESRPCWVTIPRRPPAGSRR